jgi:hypothetical protein
MENEIHTDLVLIDAESGKLLLHEVCIPKFVLEFFLLIR